MRAWSRASRRMRVVELTRFSLRDAFEEALTAVTSRPARAALTVLGTVLGVAAFVAVLGLTATASGQISQRFTELAATEVIVEDAPTDPMTADAPYPEDFQQRLEKLNGVVHAGVYWQLGSDKNISAHPPSLTDNEGTQQLPVLAAGPGYLAAAHATTSEGRLYDAFHNDRRLRVCVLGKAAAARLGITRIDAQPAIFIGSSPFVVIGIVDDVDRQPEILLSVIVPEQTATTLWKRPDAANGTPAKILIETRLGAAQLIASQAAVALRPDQPERFKVTAPPDPKKLREQISTDLGALFLALAGICLIVGTVGIANTTLVSVMERTSEIGLRRSLGARRRHISSQFLTESALLGFLGGLVGTSVGVAVVVGAAVLQQWTPVIEPLTVLPAPLIGALTGLLAGAYPSWQAGRIEPIDALRR